MFTCVGFQILDQRLNSSVERVNHDSHVRSPNHVWLPEAGWGGGQNIGQEAGWPVTLSKALNFWGPQLFYL